MTPPRPPPFEMNIKLLPKSDSKRTKRLKKKLLSMEKNRLKKIQRENDRTERERAWLIARNKTSSPPTTPGKPFSHYLKKNGAPVKISHLKKKSKNKKHKRKKQAGSEVVVIAEYKTPSQRLSYEVLRYGKDLKSWYREVYLYSGHWKALRSKAFDKYGRSCHCCGETGILDVHHLKYRSIFDVTVDDLQVLCRRCHKAEHALNLGI